MSDASDVKVIVSSNLLKANTLPLTILIISNIIILIVIGLLVYREIKKGVETNEKK